jgi:Methylase involved in ubiquinone/menaquinone biosynthesis
MHRYGYFEQFDERTARVYRFVEVALGWAYSFTANLIKKMVNAPARVLEIGPGTGVLANRLSGLGYHVVGVDVSMAMLKRGHGRFWRPDFINGGSWALPVIDDSFDVAVTVFTLHHWGDHESSMVNVVRVLKPGGVFIVVEADGDLFGRVTSHSCTAKCLSYSTRYFNSVTIRRRFPLIIAIAKEPRKELAKP